LKEQWGKLLGLVGAPNEFANEEVKNINMSFIVNNPYQPRKNFEEQKIKELAQSIKTYGLLQPVIVSRKEKGYQIVAGERRFLACKLLGWPKIPALIREYQDSSLAAVALIENLQRENLNFIEEAQGYKQLMEEFNLTQEVLAQRLGKSQSTIANKIRLLKLPDKVKGLITAGMLTERHARALLKLDSPEKQCEAVETVVQMDLNVKQTEALVQELVKQEQGLKKEVLKQRKAIVKDLRIFLNTIRQAIEFIRKAGLNPQVEERDEGSYWEVRIKLFKKSKG
jgi:ParB family chromosome partitioning protein